MDKFIDEIAVLSLCFGLMAAQPASDAFVAITLSAVAVILACELISDARLRIAVEIAALAICVFVPHASPFLPIVAYLCMVERPWSVRVLWVAAYAIHAGLAQLNLADISTSATQFSSLCALFMACCIACILAIRTTRHKADFEGMRAARDNLREYALALSARNKELSKRLEEDDPDAEADSQGAKCFDGLTERENAIVALVAQGYDNREIAGQLYLSEGTVRNHVSVILQKMQLKNRTQIAAMYYRA